MNSRETYFMFVWILGIFCLLQPKKCIKRKTEVKKIKLFHTFQVYSKLFPARPLKWIQVAKKAPQVFKRLNVPPSKYIYIHFRQLYGIYIFTLDSYMEYIYSL